MPPLLPGTTTHSDLSALQALSRRALRAHETARRTRVTFAAIPPLPDALDALPGDGDALWATFTRAERRRLAFRAVATARAIRAMRDLLLLPRTPAQVAAGNARAAEYLALAATARRLSR